MRLVPFLLVAAVLGAGCNHITTKVPGVIDLRSDASGSPIDTAPLTGARAGFDSFVSGDGTTANGGNVKIDEKRYWVIGLFSIGDNDVAPELQQANGKGALRNVHLGEEVTFMDFLEKACVTVPIPFWNLLGLVLPAIDVTVEGTHVKTGDATEPPSPATPLPSAPGTPPPAAPAPVAP